MTEAEERKFIEAMTPFIYPELYMVPGLQHAGLANQIIARGIAKRQLAAIEPLIEKMCARAFDCGCAIDKTITNADRKRTIELAKKLGWEKS
jgi:hypothetical protein